MKTLHGILTLGLFATTTTLGCSADESPRAGTERQPLTAVEATAATLPDNLFVVTNPEALRWLTLQNVLEKFVETAGSTAAGTARTAAALDLYQQWWDTNNTTALAKRNEGLHCNDLPTTGTAFECPRQEGVLAFTDPFSNPTGPDAYTPVALVNRFDLAEPGDCGEIRLVFGKNSGKTSGADRNLIIFEARIPAAAGHENEEIGSRCANIEWVWLSIARGVNAGNLTQGQFGDALNALMLVGNSTILPNHGPLLSFAHFTGSGSGQIRTNQFVTSRVRKPGEPIGIPSGQSWKLRQYHLAMATCDASGKGCVTVVPNRVKDTSQRAFMQSPPAGSPLSVFQSSFVANDVAKLARSSAATIDASFVEAGLVWESDAQSDANDWRGKVGTGAFRDAIQSKLTSLGSSLTVADIEARASTQSCGGCHQQSNGISLGGGLSWPSSGGFTHIDERGSLSPALRDVFLPARKLNFASVYTGW